MKQYIVDAFTETLFFGNPAAICITESCLTDELMMSITRENNLSETAFAAKENERYHLRWFTPGGEIDLCGHATLGCAYIIMNYYYKELCEVTFTTLSGDLTVVRNGDLYEMDFPSYDLKQIAVTEMMKKAIGERPVEAYMGRDLLCVMADGTDIKSIEPDMNEVRKLDGMMLHITAQNEKYDCVSRSFGPKYNVDEDHVCGSGHCHIVPYWTKKLKQDKLVCYQASARGGILYCTQENDRIKISGNVVLYSTAEINRLCEKNSVKTKTVIKT